MIETAPYRSGQFVAATWSAGADRSLLERLRRQVEGWTVNEGPGWLLASDSPACLADAAGVAVATTVPRLFDRRSAALRTPVELAPRLRDDPSGLLRALGAPYRLAWTEPGRGEIHAATDSSGLGHVFWTCRDGISACASSPLLLAQPFAAAVSLEGIGAFALFGTFPFAATPFEGVVRLLAGCNLVLGTGSAQVVERGQRATDADSLADAFAAAVRAMDEAAPHATLELSGGLDSRLILAAIPPERRANHSALTIHDGEASADLAIARRIAGLDGLDHRGVRVPLDAIGDGERLRALLDHVIAGYGAMANPIDVLPLALTPGQDEIAQIGGQNGEIIRGFYYPMQPLRQTTSHELVARLVDWRIAANDRVSPQLFSAGPNAPVLAAARGQLIDRLAAFDGPWGRTLDSIYLRYRMQSWAGTAASSRFVGRTILWPFFDDAFLMAAMELEPERKRDSAAAYALLGQLDRQLAAIPLDSGLVPAAMTTGGLGARAAKLALIGRKAARKIIQRVRPRSTAVLGSDLIIDGWQQTGGGKRLDLHRLASLGLFDETVLDAIGSGRLRPDRATLGFVLLCEAWTKTSR